MPLRNIKMALYQGRAANFGERGTKNNFSPFIMIRLLMGSSQPELFNLKAPGIKIVYIYLLGLYKMMPKLVP